MDKVDRVINTIRQLREEGVVTSGMTTGSSSGTPGFSEKSPAQGPTAGITPVMGKKKYATGGTGSRKKWLDYLKGKN